MAPNFIHIAYASIRIACQAASASEGPQLDACFGKVESVSRRPACAFHLWNSAQNELLWKSGQKASRRRSVRSAREAYDQLPEDVKAFWNKTHKDALKKHKNALDAKKHKDELDAKKHKDTGSSLPAVDVFSFPQPRTVGLGQLTVDPRFVHT
jgi:hypothetical protein